MFKPLLRTIPSVSGNFKLSCHLEDFITTDDITYDCYVRHASLTPLTSNIYTRYIPISLLNSNYEWDVKTFYAHYHDVFWNDIFMFNKYDLPKFNKFAINKTRNNDFEFGMKRISYQKNGYQFGFYAPIYIDNVKDIPNVFRIKIQLKGGIYTSIKFINVHIDRGDEKYNNYLYEYINRYLNKIDDNVIFMSSLTKQGNYYGIDVKNGGFVCKTDNVISKLYIKQNTIQNFDNTICLGFQRNNIIIKQILPLAFYFNIDSLLTEYEIKNYKYCEIYASGVWLDKNNNEISFYDWDTEYTTLQPKIKLLNTNTYNVGYGEQDNTFKYKNIMDCDYPGLNEGTFVGYRFSNIFNKNYFRWKLKYSTDEHPYITNCSPNFSMYQKSLSDYGEYPNDYISVIGKISNINDINTNKIINDEVYNNLELPTKGSIEFNAYKDVMNKYISSWYDLINVKNYSDKLNGIELLISENNFLDIFNDNKVLYNGILYNFNPIYDKYNDIDKIDKFACLLTLNYNCVNNKNSLLVFAKYGVILNIKKFLFNDNIIQNTNINTSVLYNTNVNNIYSTYDYKYNNNNINKHNIKQNVSFIENINSTGDFIDINDYNVDYYDINLYFNYNDINDLIIKNTDAFNEIFYNIILDTITNNIIYHNKKNDKNDENLSNNKIINNLTINKNRYLTRDIDVNTIINEFFIHPIDELSQTKSIINILPIEYINNILRKDGSVTFLDDISDNDINQLQLYIFDKHDCIYKHIQSINDFNSIIETIKQKSHANDISINIGQLGKYYNKESLIHIIVNILNELYLRIYTSETGYVIHKEIIESDAFKIYKNIYENIDRKYIFNPEKLDNNNNVILYNYLTEIYEYPGLLYGNKISANNIENDYNFIYVDPFNLNNIINEYNIKNNKLCSYIYSNNGVSKYNGDVIILNNTNSINHYCLFFNYNHFKKYLTVLYNNENTNINSLYSFKKSYILNNVYVRKKISHISNSDMCVHDMYIPLNEYFIYDNINDNNSFMQICNDIHKHLYSTSNDASFCNNFYFTNYTTLSNYVKTHQNENLTIDHNKIINGDIVLKFNFNSIITDNWFVKENNNYRFDPSLDNPNMKLNDIIIRNEFLNKDIITNINTNNNKNNEIDQAFVFNLCFKRNLVKLNNELLDIINLNNYNNYIDLYLYEFETSNDYKYDSHMQICFIDNEFIDDTVKKYMNKSNYCLKPLFKSIYYENRDDSIIYCQYKLNNINKVKIENNNTTLSYFYRNNMHDTICMLDISYFKEKVNEINIDNIDNNDNIYNYDKNNLIDISENLNYLDNNIITNINGIRYYTYDYYSKFNWDNLPINYAYVLKRVNHHDEIVDNKRYVYCDNNSYKFILSSTLMNDINNILGNTNEITYENNIYHGIMGHLIYKYGYIYEATSNKYSYFDKTFDIIDNISLEFKKAYISYSYSTYISVLNMDTTHETIYSYYDSATFDKYYNQLSDYDKHNLSYSKLFNNNLLTYTFVVSNVVKHNKLNDEQNVIYEIVNSYTYCDDLSIFDEYKLNTIVSYANNERTIYGFYLLQLNINNTSSSFNISNDNSSIIKYLSHVNNKSIISEDNLYSVFNYITPFIKINIFKEFKKQLNEKLLFQYPETIKLNVDYYSKKTIHTSVVNNANDKNEITIINYPHTYIYLNNKNNDTIYLNRYFSSITPILSKVNLLKVNSLKYKTNDVIFKCNETNEIFETTLESINHYNGIKIYNERNNFINKLYDIEYKYFNDNKFFNLENEILIDYNEYLSYSKLIYLQTEEQTIEIFKNYIKTKTNRTFSDDEILFLYKKYSVKYLSNTDELFIDKTQRYKLTYKFTLL